MKFSQIVALTIVTASPMALADDLEPISIPTLGVPGVNDGGEPSLLPITLPPRTLKLSKTADHTKSKSVFETRTREGYCIEVPWETETATGPRATPLRPEPRRDHPRRWTGEEFENNELAFGDQPQPLGGRRLCSPVIPPPIRPSGGPNIPVGGLTEHVLRPTGAKSAIGPIEPTELIEPYRPTVVGPIVFPSTTGTARTTSSLEIVVPPIIFPSTTRIVISTITVEPTQPPTPTGIPPIPSLLIPSLPGLPIDISPIPSQPTQPQGLPTDIPPIPNQPNANQPIPSLPGLPTQPSTPTDIPPIPSLPGLPTDISPLPNLD